MSEQRDIAVRLIEASREDQRFHPYKRPAGYDKFASTPQMSENRHILMAFVVVSKRQTPDSRTTSDEIAPYTASSMGEWSEQQAKYHCLLSGETYLYLVRCDRRYHPYKRPREYFRRQRRSGAPFYMDTSYFSSAVRQNLGMTNTRGSDNTVDHVTHLVQTTVLPEYDTKTFTDVNDDLSGFGITPLTESDFKLMREWDMESETCVIDLDSNVQSKTDNGLNLSESTINQLLGVLTSGTDAEKTHSSATTVIEKYTDVNEVHPSTVTVLEQLNPVTVSDEDKEVQPSINIVLEQKPPVVNPVTVSDKDRETDHLIHSELDEDEENALLGSDSDDDLSYADLSLSESAINILLGIEETPTAKGMTPSDEYSTSVQVLAETEAHPFNNNEIIPVIVTEKESSEKHMEVDKVSVKYKEYIYPCTKLLKADNVEINLVEDRKVEHYATAPSENTNKSVSTLCNRDDESASVATQSEEKHIETPSAVDVPTVGTKTSDEKRNLCKRIEVDDSLFIGKQPLMYTNPVMRSSFTATINCGGRQYENLDAQVSIFQTKTRPTAKNAAPGSQDLNLKSKSGINAFVKLMREITEKKIGRIPSNGKLNQHGVSKELDIPKKTLVNTESIEDNQRLCLRAEPVSRACTDDRKTKPKASTPFSRPPIKSVYTPAPLSSNRVMCLNPDKKSVEKRQQEQSGRTTFSTNEQRVSEDIEPSNLTKRDFSRARLQSTNAPDVHAHMKPVSKMVKIKLNDTTRKIFKPATGGRSKNVGMSNSVVGPKGFGGITPNKDNKNTSLEKRLELKKRKFESSLDPQTVIQEAHKKKFVFNRVTF